MGKVTRRARSSRARLDTERRMFDRDDCLGPAAKTKWQPCHWYTSAMALILSSCVSAHRLFRPKLNKHQQLYEFQAKAQGTCKDGSS